MTKSAGASHGAQAHRIGIDLGGTKMEGVLMAPSGGIVRRLRVPTPSSYEGILRGLKELIGELRGGEAGGESAGIGMSAPGTPTRAGLIKNSNTVCLNGKPFPADVRRVLGCEVRFANDADCLALSEATDGAGAGCGVVFAAILGTGVGGGIAIDGRVGAGPNLVRGEWGHAPLPWPSSREYPGPKCYCGRRGCIEVFVSGTGLENDYARATGETRSALEIAIAAEYAAGINADTHTDDALAARRRYAHRLARALAMMVNILDPDVIVLGGGMSNMDFLYDALPQLVRPWVFGGEFDTPIRKAVHGDSSGVRGAAWLADV